MSHRQLEPLMMDAVILEKGVASSLVSLDYWLYTCAISLVGFFISPVLGALTNIVLTRGTDIMICLLDSTLGLAS